MWQEAACHCDHCCPAFSPPIVASILQLVIIFLQSVVKFHSSLLKKWINQLSTGYSLEM